MLKKEAPFVMQSLTDVLEKHPDFVPNWKKGDRKMV